MGLETENQLTEAQISNATLIRLIRWADEHKSHYVSAALQELQERRKASGEAIPVAWPNGCDKTAPAALRYLAENVRPAGGESMFNTAHLYQLARELELMAGHELYRRAPPPLKLAADMNAEAEISGYDGSEFYRDGWNARGKADREALIKAAQDYESCFAWYEANPDNPCAESDCDGAAVAFRDEIKGMDLDVFVGLLDELQQRDKRAKQLREVVMFAKRLASSLKKSKPDSKLPGELADYLSREGLIKIEDILR